MKKFSMVYVVRLSTNYITYGFRISLKMNKEFKSSFVNIQLSVCFYSQHVCSNRIELAIQLF